MGAINYYIALDKFKPITQINVPETKQVNTYDITKVIKNNDYHVTLAQYDPICSGKITAHNLRDYRHKTFQLSLLPEIRLLFDDILEGSAFWYEKLHYESPYS